LTEDETAAALNVDPTLVKKVEQRRAVNIKAAYDLSQTMAAKPNWSLNIADNAGERAIVASPVDGRTNCSAVRTRTEIGRRRSTAKSGQRSSTG